MKTVFLALISAAVAGVAIGAHFMSSQPAPHDDRTAASAAESIKLPPPRRDGRVSLEEALLRRRSVRQFGESPLELAETAQLLWAAQGITEPGRGFRTAPSAGATFPMELYLVCGNVGGLQTGVYRYDPAAHELTLVKRGDVRSELAAGAVGQEMIAKAPASLLLAAVYERTMRRYGERGVRYVHMEAGHVAQNVYLQAAALDLATVVVGAFEDARIRRVTGIPEAEHPLYIMPVGRKPR